MLWNKISRHIVISKTTCENQNASLENKKASSDKFTGIFVFGFQDNLCSVQPRLS